MCNFSSQMATEFGLTPKLDTDSDGTALSSCLSDIGFTVRHIRDPSREEILDLAKSYSVSDVEDHPGCFLMVFLTHSVSPKGASSQERLAAYDAFFTRGDIITYLVGEGLKNGPKILIFQAPICGKSESIELSSAFNTLRRSTSGRKSTPNKSIVRSAPQLFAVPADFLVVSSSIPEYYHFKNKKSGSEFVQRLIQGLHFNAKSPSMDFEKLLTRINGQFEHRNYLAPSSPGLFDPQHPSPNWAAFEKPHYTISVLSTCTKQLFLF
ncbi:hypothetical protein RvY_10053 [Ramazzottius varieornatus]|uniref:Caspase family p20 domain-containing protein n=1 Tax=Ramazzottius varieornatus TaxID=947166 RepID=A0A1D1VDL6_RAMVA|nr:hypothetical protein RvY_10053 [Ramazzottius varieornatus]